MKNCNINIRIRLCAFIVGTAVLLLPATIIIRWKSAPPSGMHFTGFLLPDQNTYTAFMRSVFECGNGFTYASPYSAPSIDNPPVFFQIPYTILAWMWKVGSGNIVLTWEIYRLVLGAVFFAILFLFIQAVLKNLYPENIKDSFLHYFLLMTFLFLLLGGGIAWIVALYKTAFFAPSTNNFQISFLTFFNDVEKPYGGWFLNLFRNIIHPPELQYHALFFLSMYGIVTRKHTLTVFAQLLGCMSSLFAGLTISMIVILSYGIEIPFQKMKRIILIKYLIISVSIFALFVSYYALFLPFFPVSRSFLEQHRSYHFATIPLHSFFPAYGFLFLTTPLIFLSKSFRKRCISNQTGRLLIIWLVVMLLLVTHHKWTPFSNPIMPSHFLRGYLFSVLVILTAVGAFPYVRSFTQQSNKRAYILLLLPLLVHLPDNILFIRHQFVLMPHPGLLTITSQSQEVIDYLAMLEKKEVVFCNDPRLGDQIPAFTHHHSVWGQPRVTPFYEEKSEVRTHFFTSGFFADFCRRYNVSILVLYRQQSADFERLVMKEEWNTLYENSMWKVYYVGTSFLTQEAGR